MKTLYTFLTIHITIYLMAAYVSLDIFWVEGMFTEHSTWTDSDRFEYLVSMIIFPFIVSMFITVPIPINSKENGKSQTK